MARRGEADVALLQEAGHPPSDLTHPVQHGTDEFWRHKKYEGRPIIDRWPLVVQLSDRVEVEWFRAVPPISELGERDIAISGIGTVAAARVTPRGRPAEDAFIAVSMHARYIKPHPSTRTSWSVGASDVSAHRILSDISAFIGHEDPSRHRILAAGDLNMIYGATGNTLALPARERAFWDRVAALGLELLGPQAPDGWQTASSLTEVHSQARLVRSASLGDWTRQPVSSPLRTAAVFWRVRIAWSNGSNSGRKRGTLSASVPGEIGSPWSDIHAETRCRGRRQA